MQEKIHPTAIIDSTAKIGRGVEIGPYVFVGKNVTIGDGTVIHTRANITNNTIMGKNNVVHTGVIIGELAQDISIHPKMGIDDDTWVKIGDNNTFFSYSLISRGAHDEGITTIGNHCFFLGRSHVGHDAKIGDHCILSHNAMVGGHVKLENFAHIGGGSAVHQFCRIGTLSMIGAMSLVLKDVFPFSLADGRPAHQYRSNTIGLKRQNFSTERINIIGKAFRLLRSNLQADLSGLEQTKDIIFLQEWREQESKRGITTFIKNNNGE